MPEMLLAAGTLKLFLCFGLVFGLALGFIALVRETPGFPHARRISLLRVAGVCVLGGVAAAACTPLFEAWGAWEGRSLMIACGVIFGTASSFSADAPPGSWKGDALLIMGVVAMTGGFRGAEPQHGILAVVYVVAIALIVAVALGLLRRRAGLAGSRAGPAAVTRRR